MHPWKKFIRQPFVVLALAAMLRSQASATITINLAADTLKTAGGSPMPVTGLVILVASTNGVQFGGPTSAAFVSGGNVEVGRWNLSATATPGQLNVVLGPIAIPAGLSAGNALAMYWFPTLTTNATTPGAGVTYGYYRDPVANGVFASGVDGSDPWYLPADGTSQTAMYFVTTDAGGSVPATNGLASFTINTPPVANTDTYYRTSNLSYKINIVDLLTNDTDANLDSISFVGINLLTTNNVTLTTNSTDILYPAGAANVNDKFFYTITDGHAGGVVTGSVLIQIVTVIGTNSVTSLQVGVPGPNTNTPASPISNTSRNTPPTSPSARGFRSARTPPTPTVAGRPSTAPPRTPRVSTARPISVVMTL